MKLLAHLGAIWADDAAHLVVIQTQRALSGHLIIGPFR
jgi:hypothetical protein